MSYRYMRILVLFDLPVTTSENRREYARFRKHLIKSGFIMMQESVYIKLALNNTVAESIINSLRKNKPQTGIVQILTLTEKQFQKIEFIVGSSKSNIINSDERLIVL